MRKPQKLHAPECCSFQRDRCGEKAIFCTRKSEKEDVRGGRQGAQDRILASELSETFSQTA